MITPLFKPVGKSTHQLAAQYGALQHTKATHTGTLDPIASGVVVVLTGEDRYRKQELAATKKEYVATVLFGISTDTHDILGKITETKSSSETSCQAILQKYTVSKPVTFSQRVPDFSARRLLGKSSFDFARKKASIPAKYEPVTVYAQTWHSLLNPTNQEILAQVQTTLGKVEGDFRQAECSALWNQTLQDNSLRLYTAQLSCSTSKRTFIRGIVRDLAYETQVPACILSLTRVNNGPYGISDCLCLI